jgi:hypothetical protein
VTDFARPGGIVSARVDAWSGGAPGPWTRDTTTELFISGTQPGGSAGIDPAGLLYSVACGGWRVDPLKAERGPRGWDVDVANWMARARKGPGVSGRYNSRTAYFWGRGSWGGPIAGPCPPPPPPPPKEKPKDEKPKDEGGKPTPTPTPVPKPSKGGDKGPPTPPPPPPAGDGTTAYAFDLRAPDATV